MALDPREDLAVPPIADDLLPPCTTWLLLHPARVLRDFGFALLAALAPQHAVVDLRRLIADGQPLPEPAPDWQAWRVATRSGRPRAPQRIAAAR